MNDQADQSKLLGARIDRRRQSREIFQCLAFGLFLIALGMAISWFCG